MNLNIFTHEMDRVTPALDHALRDILYRKGRNLDPKDWFLVVTLNRDSGLWSGSLRSWSPGEVWIEVPAGFLHPMLPSSALEGVYGQGQMGVRFGTMGEVEVFRSGLAQSAYSLG